MARPIFIAPSILAADFARLAEEVASVELAGADFLHIDVMDGMSIRRLAAPRYTSSPGQKTGRTNNRS